MTKTGNKRGRPNNAARRAAAVAAAAAEPSDGDQASPNRSQGTGPNDRDGLSQVFFSHAVLSRFCPDPLLWSVVAF